MRSFHELLLALSFPLAWSCAHKPVVAAPPEVVPAQAKPTAAAPEPQGEATCSQDDDCGSKELCIRQRCVALSPSVELSECSLVRVHFDFDAWMIRAEDKPLLTRVARCLTADQKLHITIQGNADERGTEEYNLQLGAKRAAQVERFLEALGVSKAQLKTISYGYERPLCAEHNEACWAKNRRAGMVANSNAP